MSIIDSEIGKFNELGEVRVAPFSGLSYTALTSSTTLAVKTTGGFLHSLTIAMPSCATITIYDSAKPSGTVIYRLGAGFPMGTYLIDLNFLTGLSVDATAAGVVPNLLFTWK